jgi:hypothetical protein
MWEELGFRVQLTAAGGTGPAAYRRHPADPRAPVDSWLLKTDAYPGAKGGWAEGSVALSLHK